MRKGGCGSGPRNCLGLSGGYPAANTPLGLVRGAGVPGAAWAQGRMPVSLDELAGTREPLPPKGVAIVGRDDVLFAYVGSGGGGFGDPTERDPELVRRDVDEGRVSAQMAGEVYGVTLTDDGTVDTAATAERRAAIRRRRLERAGGGSDATGA